MSDEKQPNAPAAANQSLLELFSPDAQRPRITEAERSQLLQLQLGAPLLADMDLRSIPSVQSYEIPSGMVSFRDALVSPFAPIELLLEIKDFAKKQRASGPLPPSVAAELYYLATAAGLVHHERLIAGVTASALVDGLTRIENSDWIDSEMRGLARAARSRVTGP